MWYNTFADVPKKENAEALEPAAESVHGFNGEPAVSNNQNSPVDNRLIYAMVYAYLIHEEVSDALDTFGEALGQIFEDVVDILGWLPCPFGIPVIA